MGQKMNFLIQTEWADFESSIHVSKGHLAGLMLCPILHGKKYVFEFELHAKLRRGTSHFKWPHGRFNALSGLA